MLKRNKKRKKENRKKRKKVAKVVLKSGLVASCCLFLGVGIGAGAIVSKNTISKKEQSNFKFDVSDLSQASLENNIILT